MDKIVDGARGLFTVRTRSAEYLLDLDAATATRYPRTGATAPSRSWPARLRRDGEELHLLAVVRCECAAPMGLLVEGVDTPGVITYRRTTTVRSIERLR